MRRVLTALVVVVALVAVAGVWVIRTEPDVYLRARYPLRYDSIIRSHALTYDLDPTLLAAVVYTESRFKSSARSSAGAVGLMQLLPDTAKGIAVRTGGGGFVVSDLLDPEINVRYGSWYLRSLLRKYGDVPTALAAYHAGQGNVDRWRAAGVGIQFPETRSYVAAVLAAQKRYARAYPDELEVG
jgi:soluble lytic murein transglycosylase